MRKIRAYTTRQECQADIDKMTVRLAAWYRTKHGLPVREGVVYDDAGRTVMTTAATVEEDGGEFFFPAIDQWATSEMQETLKRDLGGRTKDRPDRVTVP